MSRRAGSSPIKTKNALIESAKKEFNRTGYRKSSLRDICSNADVTTGALYFFFDGKEGIFREIVTPVMDDLENMLREHFERESLKPDDAFVPDNSLDTSFADTIMDYFFDHPVETGILMNNMDMPVVKDFIEKTIELMDDHNYELIKKNGPMAVDPEHFRKYTVHWFSRLELESMLHLLSLGFDRETAAKQMKYLINFLKAGFASFFCHNTAK